jgi:hypothetical protein
MTATTSRYGLPLTLSLVLAASTSAQIPPKQNTAPLKIQASAQRVSGPFTHENLAIFLIHGADRIKNKEFLTLQEALAKKKVVVHETQQVNELAIENVSMEEVFAQSGDILKGGQQDRIIAFDFIVPPKSGKIPVAAFCVEAGRWQQRGDEKPGFFQSSNQQAGTKGIKQAVRAEMSQTKVWETVDALQKRLMRNAAVSALSSASPTSLQLTLEDKKLERAMNAYLEKLAPIVKDRGDVIGCAVAVNGAIEGADVYASHRLFAKVWPTLLKGSAVEALAERGGDLGDAASGLMSPAGGSGGGFGGGGGFGIGGLGAGGGLGALGGGLVVPAANPAGVGGLPVPAANAAGAGIQKKAKSATPAKPVTTAAVLAFLTDAESGKPSEQDVTNRVGMVRRESPKASLFISQDKATPGQPVPLRASYLAR